MLCFLCDQEAHYTYPDKRWICERCRRNVIRTRKLSHDESAKIGSRVKARRGNPKLREVLFEVQSGVCHYCKSKTEFRRWTIDHRTPLSRQGTNARPNLVGSCHACNNAKANLTEQEFIRTVIRTLCDGRKTFDRVMIKAIHREIQEDGKALPGKKEDRQD